MAEKVCCCAQGDGVSIHYSDGRRTFIPFVWIDQHHVKPFPLKGKRPDYEQDKYTPLQNRHYRIAVYGLATIPKAEIEKMDEKKLKLLRSKFLQAQKEINRMKNEALDRHFFFLMTKVFKEKKSSKVVQMLKAEYSDQHDAVLNTLPLSELGITKDMVVERLLKANILDRRVFNL